MHTITRWFRLRPFLLWSMALFVGCQQRPGARVDEQAPRWSIPPSRYSFSAPERLRAAGKFVSAEPPGYACPTMADVDRDGVEDLVVGQFSEGHMQFFKNLASAEESPRFAEGKWLMTGDERAVVPGVS